MEMLERYNRMATPQVSNSPIPFDLHVTTSSVLQGNILSYDTPAIIEYIRNDNRPFEEILQSLSLPQSLYFWTDPEFSRWWLPAFQSWLIQGGALDDESKDLIGGASGVGLAFLALVLYARSIEVLALEESTDKTRWTYGENEQNSIELCCVYLVTALELSLRNRANKSLFRSEVALRCHPWIPVATYAIYADKSMQRVKRGVWSIADESVVSPVLSHASFPSLSPKDLHVSPTTAKSVTKHYTRTPSLPAATENDSENPTGELRS